MKYNYKSYSIVTALTLSFFLSFQNCGKEVEFSSSTSNSESINNLNDSYDPNGVSCEEGQHFGIWLDSNDDGSIDGEKFLGSIVPFRGNDSSKRNYNYYSDSAHPYIGPDPAGFKSHVFLYEGSDGLSLNFFFNIDKGGSNNNKVHWNIEVMNNNLADNVILSDDSSELKLISTSSNKKNYEGRFQYWNNTDGGIIGPFVSENFLVKVKVLSTGDIQDATFHSSNSRKFSLKDNDEVSSFIIGFLEYRNCN